MEIKRLNGVLSAYNSQPLSKTQKKDTSTLERNVNVDRVEFGFEKALQAAKNGISAQIKADATQGEIDEAKQAAEEGISPAELAGYILLG